MKRNFTAGVAVAALGMLAALLASPSSAFAQAAGIPGTLVMKADGAKRLGLIRWQASTKNYIITSTAAGAPGLSLNVPLEQVREVIVDKPTGFDQAVAMVKSGQYSTAVPALERIVTGYLMLQWDVPATRYLAEAYLRVGQAGNAIKACEKIIRDSPEEAYKGEIAAIYWEALIKDNRSADLTKLLDKAVQEGSRELAARAQTARGDLQMKSGKFKEALVDGYLRTVLLYAAVRESQPEALFKASKCFEQLGDMVNAEKMRKRLLAEFPESSYSKQLKSGA